jgi:hypothetical protein
LDELISNVKLKEMKKYIFYIFVLLSISYFGCDKPAPTELIDDSGTSNNFEIEVIGDDLDNEYYSNGYDTSGVTEDIRRFANIISVSGIKITGTGRADNISTAQVILSDRSTPVYSPGGRLIGYNTITPGIVRFNSEQARLANLRIRYREQGVLIDTVLGKKYELFNSDRRFFGDQFVFPYNSNVNFSFTPFFGQPTSFDIPTPTEVTGTVKLVRLPDQNRFRAELNWTGTPAGKFSIVIGGVRSFNQQVFPFYRLRTEDDGSLIIPAGLLSNIPRDRFNRISISFIRKFDNTIQLDNSELYISSQSIHTIIVEIP